jgi:Uncharacterised nucleotidyltransferase
MKARPLQENWTLDVIGALRFQYAEGEPLRSLAHADWSPLLNAADRAHITLPLAVHCRDVFPPLAQRRLDDTLAANALCHSKIISAYREIADAFTRCGIRFLVLKGLAQWPWYVDDLRHRSQSDIDIYCPPESLEGAREALAELGYEPVHGESPRPMDHLPVMIRKTGWTWRGNYYDPERPPSVELHFRFWDDETEGFSVGDVNRFWRQRVIRDIGGLQIPTLNPTDGLKYSAMHLVRHLLRGDLQIRHVYELAHFLERSAGSDAFWHEWERSSPPEHRLVEAIAFRLAREWFRCHLHPDVCRQLEQLPPSVDRWFHLFGLAPATGVTRPNKDELWLHLCLIENPSARRRIAIRRLFPGRRQRVTLDPHLKTERSFVLTVRRNLYAAWFLTSRALHHCRTFVPLLRSGFRWWKAGAASL